MVSKSGFIIFFLCIVAFAIGFFIVPIYDTFKKNGNGITDFEDLTDIDVSELNVPQDGYHKWISPKGNLYMGVWENGSLKRGTLITEKGVYEGEFQNLSPNGYGIMHYNNGNIYKGNWVVGNKEGVGLKYNRDGAMYYGMWKEGLFIGTQNIHHKLEEKVYGIDISRYQPHDAIRWQELALYSDAYGETYAFPTTNHDYMHPVTFVFIKATQGVAQDPCYYQHLENARKYQVIPGAYHFFTIGDNIKAQIDNFISNTKFETGDLPPVLDIESEYNDAKTYISRLRKYGIKRMQENALKWLAAIEEHFGVKPIIYTSERWKRNFLNDKRFDSYEFWIPRYYNIEPQKNNPWVFWQRTCKAIPHGYNGEIDIDIFNGSFKNFLSYRNAIYK